MKTMIRTICTGFGPLAIFFLFAWHAAADSVTLKSGEILEGTIIDETETTLEIELRNYKGVSKLLQKSEIRLDSIRRDVPPRTKADGSSVATKLRPLPAEENRTPFAFSGSGFDFVVELARNRACPVSIDPAVISELANYEVEMAEPSTLPSAELMEAQLKPINLIIKRVELEKGLTVQFLTSPSAWAYYNAIRVAREGKLRDALAVTAGITPDSSFVGDQLSGLKRALRDLELRNSEMRSAESKVRQALDDFRSAKQNCRMGVRAAENALSDHGVKMAWGFVAGQYNRAVDAVVAMFAELEKMVRKMDKGNLQLAPRLGDAYWANMTSEAQLLFDHFLSSYERLNDLVLECQKEGIDAGTVSIEQQHGTLRRVDDGALIKARASLGEMPSWVRNWSAELGKRVQSGEKEAKTGIALLTLNPRRASRCFTRSLYWDQSSLIARVGAGYTLVQSQIDSLNKLKEASASTYPGRVTDLEKDCRNRGQYNQLLILDLLRPEQKLHLLAPKPSRVGSVIGLATQISEGNLYPLSVRIEDVPRARWRYTEYELKKDYWGNVFGRVFEIEGDLAEFPIKFGDYGTKDLYTWVSAVQAYKWLQSVDDAVRSGNKGLRIELHDLYSGLGGDSASVTFAVGAYSVLKSNAVKPAVAMTGSIRADGAVKGVGEVPQKIQGAFYSEGIDTIVVPYENRLDLLALPLDQLMRMAIIMADDIRTYLKYALEKPVRDVTAEDHWQTQQALTQLRVAQVLLLLGERTVATELLESVATSKPEIYNARRLMELLRREPPSEGPRHVFFITREEADRIVARLNPPMQLSRTPSVQQAPAAPVSSTSPAPTRAEKTLTRKAIELVRKHWYGVPGVVLLLGVLVFFFRH